MSLNIFCPYCGVTIYGGTNIVLHLNEKHGIEYGDGNKLTDEIYRNLVNESNRKRSPDSNPSGDQTVKKKLVLEQLSLADDAMFPESPINYRVVRLVDITRPLIGTVLTEEEVRVLLSRPSVTVEITPKRKK